MKYPAQDVYAAIVPFLDPFYFYFSDRNDDLGALLGSMNVNRADNRSMDPAYSAEWDETTGNADMDADEGFRAMLKLLERNVPGVTGDTDYLPRLLEKLEKYKAEPELFQRWEATLRSVYEEAAAAVASATAQPEREATMFYSLQDVYDAIVAFLEGFYHYDKDKDLGALAGAMHIDRAYNRSIDPAFSAEWDEITGGTAMDADAGFRAMLKLLEPNVPRFTGDTNYLPGLLQRLVNYSTEPELFRYWETTLRSVYEENQKG